MKPFTFLLFLIGFFLFFLFFSIGVWEFFIEDNPEEYPMLIAAGISGKLLLAGMLFTFGWKKVFRWILSPEGTEACGWAFSFAGCLGFFLVSTSLMSKILLLIIFFGIITVLIGRFRMRLAS